MITDDTSVSIRGTLWGDDAQKEYKVGDIIACSGVRIGEFGGKSLSLGGYNTINPEKEERYHELKEWYQDRTSNGQELKTQSLTQPGGENVNTSQLPLVLIQEMQNENLTDNEFLSQIDSKPKYHQLSVIVRKIFVNRDMHYTGCPVTRRKVE